jgi:hypothetical protein
LHEILVVCPGCGACARILPRDASRKETLASRRLVCIRCGHTEEFSSSGMAFHGRGQPRDPYFGLPLWLQTPCGAETLWAYNREHVAFIESLVTANHRQRARDEIYGTINKQLASRLPRWIKSAKKRATIVAALERLKRKLQYP